MRPMRWAIFLLLCAYAGPTVAEVPLVDFCAIVESPETPVVRFEAVAGTDNRHGIYLRASGCDRRLRIGHRAPGKRPSATAFFDLVASGGAFRYRLYEGTFTGRVVRDAEGERDFEVLDVTSFREIPDGAK